MALKYFIKYRDIVQVEHILNIYDDNFSGTPTRVGGRVFLDHGEVDTPIEAIRGQGLRVELEANAGLNFNDLFTEEERVINCQYSRDGIILFNGWLNPEGFFEDFVQSNWVVSFDCVDGLSYLSDLSFVDSNGFAIKGRRKYIEILALSLKRTGLNLKINTDVRIRYDGLDPLLDPLDNVYANTARYIEEDNDTITDCEKVVRDILEPFTACITLFNNEWYIFKPNQLFGNQTADFYSYDADGVFIEKKTLDTAVSIGSQINDFSIFHCGANQSITNKSSLGAYRVNYKYGLVQSLIDNNTLFSFDGITIEDFFIYTPNNLRPLIAGESSIFIEASKLQGTSNPIPDLKNIRNSSGVRVLEEVQTDVEFTVFIKNNETDFPFGAFQDNNSFRYQIILSENNDPDIATGAKYYLNSSNLSNWETTPQTIKTNVGKVYHQETKELSIKITTPKIPLGFTELNLFIVVKTPTYGPTTANPDDITHNVTIINVKPSQSQDGSEVVVGEFHTVQRTDRPSAKVDEVKKVLTGDNPSDFYEGTIYKSDSTTPTSTWSREGFTEEKPLLQIMVEDTARVQQSTAREFSGDVFGYFPYLSLVSIDGLNGLFMPIKYEYDTKENVVNATLRQIFAGEVADLEYKKTFDFGNTVKPTIKG